MHNTEAGLIFSATDLSGFLACPQLPLLRRSAALGGPQPPKFDDPSLELLKRRGEDHERAFLEGLKQGGRRIVEIVHTTDDSEPRHARWRRLARETMAAMRQGADAIYQAVLFDGTWLGFADFLLRVGTPGSFGEWSYEVADTKLAREAKGGALLQVLLYSDLLAQVQGVTPVHVHIALGGPAAHTESFRVAAYAAYFRSIRARFLDHVRSAAGEAHAPEPVEHCGICEWSVRCGTERRDVDHLSLVAGIGRPQRRTLGARGITTMAALASAAPPLEPRLEGVSPAAYARIHHQARVQVDGRARDEPVHELLTPVTPGQGLAALPEPSPGDLFLDLEADPYALGDGIEYLFGYSDRDGRYTASWALDRAHERGAFENFIDLVVRRLDECPDMHVYHFGHYEPTALKRLVGRYGTRQDELDRLLRGGVLVDLHRVVKQGLRASVESYSLKQLEPFYGFTRDVSLADARRALATFEAWLELGGGAEDGVALRGTIEGYNRDDVTSTLRLHAWLESLRAELARLTGAPVPRPERTSPEPDPSLAERTAQVEALVARLTHDLPADTAAHDDEQRARWLMAQLLGYHRREQKSDWWEYYRCLELSDDELIEDRATLGGLVHDREVGAVKQSVLHRYTFPPQDHALRAGRNVDDPRTRAFAGEVVDLDDVTGTITLRRGASSTAPHPEALVLKDIFDDRIKRGSLMRTGESVVAHGLSATANPLRSSTDLLLRRAPRAGQPHGAALMLPGESPLQAALRLVTCLDGTVLSIQGPPGSGKTYTGAHMIVHALAHGLRVGVSALGHKVIANLLHAVADVARRHGVAYAGMQKVKEDDEWCGVAAIPMTKSNDAVREALTSHDIALAAGTAWLWSRADMVGAVDLLFVDEAGQFPLADALAVAPAAHSIVLLGDPAQLDQPQQGVHPPGVGSSALEHLLGDDHTMPAERGLFLDRTHRLHPDICAFTSELFYAERLHAHDGLEQQRVHGPGALTGSGLRFLPVAHSGNSSESPEEVRAVMQLVASLTAGRHAWTDQKGQTRTLTLADVLVVAPYNAQVAALTAALPPGARVGTVDRFQGQEAAVVIYSMTTSSAEDAPRGMSFLYSANRLNVATSRARCLAVVVASPLLFTPDCRTPGQMRLANAFCRFAERAQCRVGVEETSPSQRLRQPMLRQ